MPTRLAAAWSRTRRACLLACLLAAVGIPGRAEPRPPQGEGDLRRWLETMILDHGFGPDEVAAATGLSAQAAAEAMDRWKLSAASPAVAPGEAVRVRPYPGGRHPRLGFLDGAVNPQRDTKLSVFTPWDPRSYVVVDVPEAIWSDLGLTYLAHTHIPTIWDARGLAMEPREWSRRADGTWTHSRTLPNGVAFGVRAFPEASGVVFRWWIRNGSAQPLTRLRAQVCVMLGRAAGFGLPASPRLLEPPFAAARDVTGRRWVLTAWQELDRVWENPPVPCIHSDPRMEDCPPGAERSAWGGVWFHEGDSVTDELARRGAQLQALRTAPPPAALAPIPEKLVVLTFDDSVASHFHRVAPLLKERGFGATFFITEGFSFRTNKTDYLTWEQIASLHRDGFEIGNHTATHMGVGADTLGRLPGEVALIAERCEAHGIPRPISFAYPGNAIHPGALPLLRELGFRFARRGGQPERPYGRGEGVPYDPAEDDPLLIPTAGDARPDWTLDDLRRAVAPARAGRIAVLQFHGVPDREHPWVNTPPERFVEYLDWLKDEGYRCIAVRDLARYVDPTDHPAEPWSIIERRQASAPR